MLGSGNLFFIKNPAWKQIRSRLTPFFTSGKMKQMFHLMNETGDELNALMMSMKINDNTKMFCTEMKDLCARYTTDIVASCAFGVKANSLRDPNSEFRKCGRAIFDFTLARAIEFTSLFFIPEIVPIFRFKTFSKPSTKFLRDSIEYVMDEREKAGTIRNDLIDTLVSLRNEDKNKIFSTSEVG